MNYAIWQLDFTDQNYGIGPEEKSQEIGISCESGWAKTNDQNETVVLGYLSAPLDEALFAQWNLQNVSAATALDFVRQVDPSAHIATNGRIAVLTPLFRSLLTEEEAQALVN